MKNEENRRRIEKQIYGKDEEFPYKSLKYSIEKTKEAYNKRKTNAWH